MNGRIQSQIVVEGVGNEYGETTPSTISWGDEVDCKYVANTQNNSGRYVDGEFTKSAYSITISDVSFNANVIRLTNNQGVVICVKEVQSLELLDAIQRVKISV